MSGEDFDRDLFGRPTDPAPAETRGRKKHAPRNEQRDLVQTLCGLGVPQDEIAAIVRIDATTLRERYRDELDRGGAVANAAIARNLYRKAIGDGREAVTAAMFWLRCRAGWSEYAPRPDPRSDPRPTPLGKKDAAALAAETAEEGTGWSGLVH